MHTVHLGAKKKKKPSEANLTFNVSVTLNHVSENVLLRRRRLFLP